MADNIAKKTTTKKVPAKKTAAASTTTKTTTKATSPAGDGSAKNAPLGKTTGASESAETAVTQKPTSLNNHTKVARSEAIFDGPLGQALDAVKTPVYAYVGVNDLAIKAISGIVMDLRKRAGDAVSESITRVNETRDAAARRAEETAEMIQELPAEVSELVERFRPEELRKVAEAYVEVAAGIYNGLAVRGEDVVNRLREEQPELEAGLRMVNERFNESVELGEEALGTVARQTRSVGNKAATRVGKAAKTGADATRELAYSVDALADVVDELGDEAAEVIQTGTQTAESRIKAGRKATQPRTATGGSKTKAGAQSDIAKKASETVSADPLSDEAAEAAKGTANAVENKTTTKDAATDK